MTFPSFPFQAARIVVKKTKANAKKQREGRQKKTNGKTEDSGHAHMPLAMVLFLLLFGLCFVVAGLSNDLKITTVHDDLL